MWEDIYDCQFSWPDQLRILSWIISENNIKILGSPIYLIWYKLPRVRIPPIVRSDSSIGRAGGPLAVWFWVQIPVGTLASILGCHRGLLCHVKDLWKCWKGSSWKAWKHSARCIIFIFTQGAPAGESLNGIGIGDPLPPVTEKFVWMDVMKSLISNGFNSY